MKKNVIKQGQNVSVPDFGNPAVVAPNFAAPSAAPVVAPKSNLPPGISKLEINPNREHQNNVVSVVPQQSNVYRNQAVIAMQNSLINLSKDVLHDLPTEKFDQGTIEKNENSHSFLDFIAQNSNYAKSVGKQMVNVDLDQPTRLDTGKKNDKFVGMIQSLSHIGSPSGGEQVADGVWGSRTSNALRQVYALAEQLVLVASQMGAHLSGYTSSNLNELLSLIKKLPPTGGPSINEQTELAQAITKNIEQFRKFLTDFKDKILSNQDFQPFINQDKPLISHKNKEQGLSEMDTKSLQNYGNQTIPIIINGRTVPIRPVDLASLKNFKEYLAGLNAQGVANIELDDVNVQNYLGYVINNLESSK